MKTFDCYQNCLEMKEISMWTVLHEIACLVAQYCKLE